MGMIPAPGVQWVPIPPCPLGISSSASPQQSSSPHPRSVLLNVPPGRKANAGNLAWVFRVFFPTFDVGQVPLPSPLELFNLEGQRRKGKVRWVHLEWECFGGKVWKTAGELVLTRGWEGIEMAQGETREERQSRAVGVEESSWLLRVAELVSGPWAESVAPSSHEFPLFPHLAQPAPSTSHCRPTCSLFPASCPYRTYPLPFLVTVWKWTSEKI